MAIVTSAALAVAWKVARARLAKVPPSWYLVLLLAGRLLGQGWRLDRAQGQRDKARDEVVRLTDEWGKERQALVDTAKAEQVRLAGDYVQIMKGLTNEIERQRRAGARLRADIDGMHDDAQQLRRRVAATAAAGRGAAADEAIGVLAGLHQRSEREREAVARFAEQSRAAGLACERAHDAASGVAGAAALEVSGQQ